MSIDVDPYVGRLKDSNVMQSFLKVVSAASEEDRFDAVMKLLDVPDEVNRALRIANHVLRSRQYFLSLLDLSLETSNPHTMKYWLECIIPRLGFRRTVFYLQYLGSHRKRQLGWAVYQLGWIVDASNHRDMAALEALDEFVKAG